ncbi:NirD/YgiW/YdeI family stress tolerance protein [Acinetobacter tianfuensis]|uniref:NirD/YgiW/YdeI family stress tolerance protein n=1 Tax=Acinetobacter tianfuensis TaxID=2419603 RepID=A0A3A8E7X9_9GAMM|nr:NirD/YgiW/YdeI family stress tolerance protein [Acinetobacter tianfuensis]RKG30715.1 NirD/YgiW/YdeI family stress tolerance protein [Acinetobacter tianfuensis]
MNKRLKAVIGVSLMLCAAGAWAKDDRALLQEAAKNHVQVSAVKQLKDETAVTLTGTLVKHLNQDHYEFSDGTGLILLDIDDDDWKASGVQAGDKVRVAGEVDTHRYKPTDIEVVKIEKLTE